MVSHICLLVELGPICNSMAALLCLKSCEDHRLLKSYNGGIWKNNYRSGPSYIYAKFEAAVRLYNGTGAHQRQQVDEKWLPLLSDQF